MPPPATVVNMDPRDRGSLLLARLRPVVVDGHNGALAAQKKPAR